MKPKKKILIMTFAAALALPAMNAAAAPAAAAASAAESAQEPSAKSESPTQIIFVPKKMLFENRDAGKLKENVFYWTNVPGDPKQGPVVKQEDGKTYLSIKGTGNEDADKSLTQVNVIRAFNPPQGAKQAIITVDARLSYDPWADSGNYQSGIGWGMEFVFKFIRDGKESPRRVELSTPGLKTQGLNASDGKFHTWTATTPVPPGAQLLFYISTDHPNTIDLAGISVEFK